MSEELVKVPAHVSSASPGSPRLPTSSCASSRDCAGGGAGAVPPSLEGGGATGVPFLDEAGSASALFFAPSENMSSKAWFGDFAPALPFLARCGTPAEGAALGFNIGGGGTFGLTIGGGGSVEAGGGAGWNASAVPFPLCSRSILLRSASNSCSPGACTSSPSPIGTLCRAP